MCTQNKLIKKGGFKSKRLNEIFNDYILYLETSGLAEQTQVWRIKHVSRFFSYVDTSAKKPVDILPIYVYDYINSIQHKLSVRTIYNRSTCIRLLFDWMYENDLSKFKGIQIFGKLRKPMRSNILSYYHNDELKLLLDNIEIDSKNGKRDYLLISLFVYYGFRQNDLRNLKISEINWRKEKITMTQNKTRKEIELFLIAEVKFALLDYLINARPQSSAEYLFVRKNGRQYSHGQLGSIVRDCFLKSGVNTNNRKTGSHSLRHSLASNLLRQNSKLSIIAQVLGHSDLKSTAVYLAIDELKLKQLALEVPIWTSN